MVVRLLAPRPGAATWARFGSNLRSQSSPLTASCARMRGAGRPLWRTRGLLRPRCGPEPGDLSVTDGWPEGPVVNLLLGMSRVNVTVSFPSYASRRRDHDKKSECVNEVWQDNRPNGARAALRPAAGAHRRGGTAAPADLSGLRAVSRASRYHRVDIYLGPRRLPDRDPAAAASDATPHPRGSQSQIAAAC